MRPRTMLRLHQLSANKTIKENQLLTTDSKVASYKASYEDPLTRKIKLKALVCNTIELGYIPRTKKGRTDGDSSYAM